VGTLPAHRSRAVRALVLLHEEHLRAFMGTWRRALAAEVKLPQTDDPSYESLATLGRHVLRAARGYMTWMCEKLQLPDPEIRETPATEEIVGAADSFLEHVLERWRVALKDVADDQLETPEYPSRWKTLYSIDAMLEHAVMHPIRHKFQLEELLKK
jgi:uncharacterized damage-inducible protein DinB